MIFFNFNNKIDIIRLSSDQICEWINSKLFKYTGVDVRCWRSSKYHQYIEFIAEETEISYEEYTTLLNFLGTNELSGNVEHNESVIQILLNREFGNALYTVTFTDTLDDFYIIRDTSIYDKDDGGL